MAQRTASELARGLGVDLSLSGAISRNVERETIATALSNSGFHELRPGEVAGPNNTRVSASVLQNEAKDVALRTGMDTTDVLQGARAFVGVTGDLDQSRKLMGDLSKISKATNADLTDVSRAAAKINAQMGETPTKAEDTLAVVRLLAGQGKLGAAEMSDFAKSIGKIAGTAHQFKGDTTNNIAELSAMAQFAAQKFGLNPAEAATSVTGFANTLSKNARVKEFVAAGIKDYATLTPEQLVTRSLVATKGNNLALGKLFADVRARRVVRPFEQVFNAATGGKTDSASLQAGVKAVEAAFDSLKHGAMSAGEVDKEFAAQMDTAASKAKIFQTQLDDVATGVQAKLLPAFEKLEPAILAFAETAGKVATWMVDNPKQAIGAAILAAITRGGIESAFRAGIETIITTVAARLGIITAVGSSGAVGAAGAATGATAMGVAGVGLLAATGLGATAWQSYELTKDVMRTPGGIKGVWHDVWNGPSKATTPEEYDRLYPQKPTAQANPATPDSDDSMRAVRFWLQKGRPDIAGLVKAPESSEKLSKNDQELLEEMRSLNQHMQAFRRSTLNVHVDNMPVTPPEPHGGRTNQL
ncbi:MAG TPA: phage tail tape measure protein [Polyangiaceae bacterium]|nr:phage tail tape measure protein [Polyangiaceae bacterium]